MITCQHCSTRNHDGAIFCDNCGRELAPARGYALPTAPPQPGARRESAPHAAAPGPYAAFASRPQYSAPQPASVQIVLQMPDGQRIILRGKDEYTIGRDDNGRGALDVDLARWDGFSAGVSRTHVQIQVSPDGVFVKDLESTNETIHNGYRLAPQQWYPLFDGDVLKLGAITLHVTFERP